jgi:methylenetetrahydrofolate dehydrogenase (NADP+)/methenyltetrahydrofolate cyclohydrolase
MIIDGKKIAQEVRNEVKKEVEELRKEGVTPGLAVILVGENPASLVYVRQKEKACEEVGIVSYKYSLPEEATEEKLLSVVDELNGEEKVHGILVQLPLPKHLDEKKVIEKISPEKDVDGFHPLNMGRLFVGEPSFVPCTPRGVIELIERSGFEIKGKKAVIVGRSNIVGKPVAVLLLMRHATITVCHTRTKDLATETREADILVVAAGRPRIITGEMVKEGAIVIDVGINRVDGKLVGDVDFDSVSPKVSAITPVPGGVGPMTVAMLMKNTLEAAKKLL